jgi:hypothetical protein
VQLLEREIIHGDELEGLLGKRPEGSTKLSAEALLSRAVSSASTRSAPAPPLTPPTPSPAAASTPPE